jgi:hypothetical protein
VYANGICSICLLILLERVVGITLLASQLQFFVEKVSKKFFFLNEESVCIVERWPGGNGEEFCVLMLIAGGISSLLRLIFCSSFIC